MGNERLKTGANLDRRLEHGGGEIILGLMLFPHWRLFQRFSIERISVVNIVMVVMPGFTCLFLYR